ncbi:MAG TPA: DUF1906 domain-containing protein [Solirubrobacterales bacterium]|nr:DUF1906 domain-containing protein [Solirubrobacterales bacterium]
MTSGSGKRLSARLLLGAALLVVALAAWVGSAAARGGRTVHYAGRAVHVPAGFKVVRVGPHSRTCVRLDRRVVYLGSPSKEQRCPAGPLLGRHRAIVVTPSGRRAAASSLVRPRPAVRAARASAARASKAPATGSVGGSVFTGLGFDTCSAPSTKAMAAWADSPYRGVGIYIGGENSACSQPNLSASWVSAQTTAGWHLIPTYVGLQAPTSSCSSCAKLTAAGASSQGAAAAEDAVTEAAAIGIGTGSPIYFDMEAYSPTTSATNAVLTFLAAWTEKLHALGYQSGVYSSSSSGIADLADADGTGYASPDDIWTANWNNAENTLDPVVPSTSWANHQRIHQFRGGHDETYGGTTLNIDSDYVDGATVGVGTPPVGESDPIGSLELTSSPAAGQVHVKGWALDPDAPTETLAINVVVGGRAGQKGVETFELGQVANQERADVAASHRLAGPLHGFDTTFFTIRSGPEPICVYALNVALGGNRLLGCKTTKIPVAVAFTRLKAMPHGIKVTLACQWPTGTSCPGHLGLRTTYRIATPRRHRPPRIHAVTRSLGSRTFRLNGGHWHTFYLPLTPAARRLLRERGKLRTQVIAAIPGGRRGAGLPLEAPAPRR